VSVALLTLSEKDVEHQCDSLVHQCGGDVVRFSQVRASKQTPGISDRRYRVHGVAWWFEVKRLGGRLSVAQHEFLLRELACGSVATCGGVQELAEMIESAKDQNARDLCMTPTPLERARRQVATWWAKGHRRTAP